MSYVETEERPSLRRNERRAIGETIDAPRSARLPRQVSERTLASLDVVAAIAGFIMTLGPLTVYAVFGSG